MSYAPSGKCVHSNLLGIALEHFLGAAALATVTESKFTLPHDRPRTLRQMLRQGILFGKLVDPEDGNISK